MALADPFVVVPAFACCWFSRLVVSAALESAGALPDTDPEGDWLAVFTLPALFPAVGLSRSPLVVMPPVLVLGSIPLEALTPDVLLPVAALVFDEALLLIEPAGVVAEVVPFIPVPRAGCSCRGADTCPSCAADPGPKGG